MTKKYLNGVLVDLTAEEEAQKNAEDAKMVELQADYDAKQYQRDRELEYPSMADQLDDIYHNGIDAWKATIKTIKDKYPKE